jgi:hypothetical protein
VRDGLPDHWSESYVGQKRQVNEGRRCGAGFKVPRRITSTKP